MQTRSRKVKPAVRPDPAVCAGCRAHGICLAEAGKDNYICTKGGAWSGGRREKAR